MGARQTEKVRCEKGEKLVKTLAFFNNKGGVGKTSLAYHVSWMLSELNYNVLTADLDPQANLTGMFMDEAGLEEVFNKKKTVFYALKPLFEGTGDIRKAEVFTANEGLKLLPGDLNISLYEGEFADSWSKCLEKKPRDFRVTSSFYRLISEAGEEMKADWAVIDMGPNLGAVNRAALIASDYLISPLGPDLFSFQGLKNAGQFINEWRGEWNERKKKGEEAISDFSLPEGRMQPVGYVMMRHSIRHNRPVKAYQKWMDKMPEAYRKYVLRERKNKKQKEEAQTLVLTQSDLKAGGEKSSGLENDKDHYLLAHLKDYRSLMPMAQNKNKPMFLLKQGDGAIGSHFHAVQDCYKDFKILTKKIISACENHP